MTREQFNELFKDGLNSKNFAEIIGTSEGHLNELKRKPNAREIAETFGLIEEDVQKVLDMVNLDAVYNFMVAKGINDLTEEQIALAKAKYTRVKRALQLEVGLETPFGKIVKIQKVGKTNIYMCMQNGEITAYGTTELKDAFKKTNEDVEVDE